MWIERPVTEFLDALASDHPTPGGGSASALAGAQAAALVEMVLAVTMKSEKYAAACPVLEPMKSAARDLRTELVLLVDRDAESYEAVVAANRMAKQTEEEKALRREARESALMFATEIPLKTVEMCCAVAGLAEQAAPHVNPSAASDLLVAVSLAEAALAGGAANVRINLESLKSESFTAGLNERLDSWAREAASSAASVRSRFV